MTSRHDELAAGLARTRERIATACAAAGRDPDDVTLIVVTKFFPAADVELLYELGVRDVGESRHQEAQAKVADLAHLKGLRWHFIGGLQSNKAAAVARYVDVVQVVDRPALVAGLAKGAVRRADPLQVLLQADLDPDPKPGRGGAAPAELVGLAREVEAQPGLWLRGVMAIAPLGEDPSVAFGRLAAAAADVREAVPGADWISAGMSGDLEAAIANGATHVRVGSAILGSRYSER